ncbi:MAG: hypothetical protein ABI612_19175, partial [Betaproteobacteria bacterium]
MAGAAGALVVSLGLNAAEYTNGLTKAEFQARNFATNIGAGLATAGAVGAAGIAAIGAAAVAAFVAVDQLVKQAGQFQDIS